MRYFFTLTLLFLGMRLFASSPTVPNNFESHFNLAYQLYPDIPKGVLEAVSFTQTHFKHIDAFEPESCSGLPKYWGVMGLIQNGKSYFRENLKLVSQLSNYSENDIKTNPEKNILAYAAAYSSEMQRLQINSLDWNKHAQVLVSLSELPDTGDIRQNFALNSHLYSVFSFLNNSEYQISYGFPQYNINLVQLFGQSNLEILSATKVLMGPAGVQNPQGQNYQSINRSNEYGPAIWNPAPSCNYSSRSGTAISAITIHTIQGSYAGAISWSQNCNSNVSYHYVIRSSDGQVTQMVLEANKAWHVGSANPYTIGYEHEGYVSDPSWYTTAMYNSSADLSRDVTQSGYGINPLRTYYGPSSSGGNVLGSCTRIKGHQHYPNQSHTDPGINWDWERYYKLINNNPPQTTITSTSGNLYDSGGATGNYSDDERELYLIQPPNASNVTINFNLFDLEANWDYMYIYDGATTSSSLIGIYTGTANPGTVSSTGGSLLIEFRSDCATNNQGWDISYSSSQIPGTFNDSIQPTVSSNNPPNWVTSNFNLNYTDIDNTGGSGVEKAFYQVIDLNGTDWRANENNGFFSDNFDQATIHSDWTAETGVWALQNGVLQQADESNSNTNIHADLTQNLSNSYLYHWSGKIDGTGSNKRAGLHFFCDNPSATNRGNSYFVYFREDNDKVQIYSVDNDVFNLEVDEPYTINSGQWYDFKVSYDRIAGEINVWVDNEHAASWTDPSPLSNGSQISLRSGNCIWEVNNLKVYRSRASNVSISVGAGNDLRFQNANPTAFAGKVKSIIVDSAKNLSSIHSKNINVDWTDPSDIANVNDGPAADINITYSNTELEANWSLSTDTNSAISRYWYAIGTSAGATDVMNWTDNWIHDTAHVTGLNLSYGTTYYFSVRSENGAGLLSNPVNSDGQLLSTPSSAPTALFNPSNTFICAGDSILLNNASTNAVSYTWSMPGASPSSSTATNPYISYNTTGTYTIELTATGPGGTDIYSQTVNITVEQAPIASATLNGSTFTLPNAFVAATNTSQNANGYFWDFGDGFTSTDVSPWHNYTSPGTYDIMLIAINGVCPNDTTYMTIVVDGTVAIDEIQNEISSVVYPNPNQGSFLLAFELNIAEKLNIQILDMRGRLVYQKNASFGVGRSFENIDLDLSSGLYMLQITGENNLKSQHKISIK
jgi:PKD repeat protein/N-acetyl-anhydromuramyl-L-alanine amidase AmpD